MGPERNRLPRVIPGRGLGGSSIWKLERPLRAAALMLLTAGKSLELLGARGQGQAGGAAREVRRSSAVLGLCERGMRTGCTLSSPSWSPTEGNPMVYKSSLSKSSSL